eukprot:TRINITY_DN45455_c1_g2_i1.p1 TRINITY_DN45455_c1_g2~~TRINITY_DN45455_c1_g2_i1.p1  ORF type:complete len:216 (-),score=17.64 TRINITY_DN45455_c1_g2_i1:87-734(-)
MLSTFSSMTFRKADRFKLTGGLAGGIRSCVAPVRRSACSGEALEDLARALYEKAWSTGDIDVLDKIMAEDHDQRDMVWQPKRHGGGRERMKRGIGTFRKYYDDLTFNVERVACDVSSQTVMVEWLASGTPAQGGPTEKFGGVSVLEIDHDMIARTRAYRQAPKEEAAMIQGQKQSVKQSQWMSCGAAGPQYRSILIRLSSQGRTARVHRGRDVTS